LIPTIAGDNSGFARISEIFVCSSASVFGGDGAGFGCCATAAAKLKHTRR
jgi:hypothetical protein